MASLSRRNHEFDADLWADLAARLLGVAAAFGLAALGLIMLFPAVGAGHLPVLPLGAAEPQRPLIGLLCFALSAIVATAVMLFKTPEPPIRRSSPAPREMNLAPAGPAEAPILAPVLAPFPAAEPWRAPPPPVSDLAAVDPVVIARPEPPPETTEIATPQTDPEVVLLEAQPATVALDMKAEEAIAPPAPLDIVEPLALQPEPQLEPATVDLAPLVNVEPAETLQAPPEPDPSVVEDDFDGRRERLKATLAEAGALAAALSAQAADHRQHALAAQDVGDIALASGAPDRAADAYDRALLHARTLMEAHPDTPAVRTVLAEVLAKIGDLNTAKGRMGAAMDAYEEALTHRREAARLGDGQSGRLDLAAALENLAKVRQARGETEKARALYAESLEHLGPLAEADPSHGDMAYRAKLSLLALDS
ncbi:MAG: hypothetical protein JWM33_72 [Caulobacteraceae bacterium]|nr:hypothetical protein [Caulobacteraceae bacterium]